MLRKLLSVFLITILFLSANITAQIIDNLGLSDKHITALKIGEGILAIGTDFNGVYWQPLGQMINDTSWNKIDFDSAYVTAVYPHKSGPLGWAIGIAAEPNIYDTNFIYCSYLGSKPKTLGYGIDREATKSITGLDGFPDPTICGETFAIGGRKLYRRYFMDTVWNSVYDLTIEGSFESLKAREEFAEVYAGGVEGFAGMLLIRTKDKGDTWENLSPLCAVSDVDFWNADDTTIFVTDRFKVMRSIDDGRTWKNVYQTDSLAIQKISFSPDGKLFYMVSNTIFYNLPRSYLTFTYDYGEHWITEQLPVYDIIAGMDVDYENNIYLAYITSGVYKITSPVVNIGMKDKADQLSNFTLYDNYPNPFNPTTRIKYSIGSSQFVQLKVYDILGNEIAILVNEEKPAGTYQVDFNPASYIKNPASGIYFYQLLVSSLQSKDGKAGKNISTHKMMFLK